MTIDRSTVLEALRVDDVLAHFQIPGHWVGRGLRSRRCPTDDHDTLTFWISDAGKWHCHSCGTGGDLLKLIALASKLDVRSDFSRVLDVAGEIAGVDSEGFGGRPAPPARAPLPPVAPLVDRIAVAKHRAAWVWDRMFRHGELARPSSDLYLAAERELDVRLLHSLEDIRHTPMRATKEEVARSPAAQRQVASFSIPGVALPVRSIEDGALVDVRIRRLEPKADEPKVIGMLGGVTVGSDAGTSRLVGCYGHPNLLPWYPNEPDMMAVVVEGFMDYLTALMAWPGGFVLGAVDAGSFALVTRFAAERISGFPRSQLLLVEQHDAPKVRGDGTTRLGAADRVINEDVNAALKVATRILGAARVGILRCAPEKDLNAMLQRGATCEEIRRMAVFG